MTRLGTAVGAGVLLVMVAACANPQTNPSGQDRPPAPPSASQPTPTTGTPPPSSAPTGPPPSKPPVSTRPMGEEAPAGSKPLPPERIERAALPQDYPAKAWIEPGDGRTIDVVAQEGGCGQAGAEVVEQSPARVVIKVYEAVPTVPRACTMDLRYPTLSITLDAPLGDRKVVLLHEIRKV